MPTKKELTRQRRKNRIRSQISGTAERPRLSVFRSASNNYAQLIDDENGITLVSCNDLKAKKGTKVEKATEVGKTIATKAKEKKIAEVVFDRNGYKYHGRIKAIAEAAREGGLKF